MSALSDLLRESHASEQGPTGRCEVLPMNGPRLADQANALSDEGSSVPLTLLTLLQPWFLADLDGAKRAEQILDPARDSRWQCCLERLLSHA